MSVNYAQVLLDERMASATLTFCNPSEDGHLPVLQLSLPQTYLVVPLSAALLLPCTFLILELAGDQEIVTPLQQ